MEINLPVSFPEEKQSISSQTPLNSKLHAKELRQQKLWRFVDKEAKKSEFVKLWCFRNSVCMTKKAQKYFGSFVFVSHIVPKFRGRNFGASFIPKQIEVCYFIYLRTRSYAILNSEYQSQLSTANKSYNVTFNQNCQKVSIFHFCFSGNLSTFNRNLN